MEQDLSTVSTGDREILELARENKIEAIKRYRERHQVGLKEAKDAVESLMARNGIIAGNGKGCATVLLTLVLCPTLMYWLVWS